MATGQNKTLLSPLHCTLLAQSFSRRHPDKAPHWTEAQPHHAELFAASLVAPEKHRSVALERESEAHPSQRAHWTRRRIGPGSESTGHFQIGSPDLIISRGPTPGAKMPWETRRLTGMPEFVLIPAPVTTTTFFALYSEFAMSCSSRADSGVTCTVGILGSALVSGQRARGDGESCALSGAFEPSTLAQSDHSS